jgi:hypothetical protein
MTVTATSYIFAQLTNHSTDNSIPHFLAKEQNVSPVLPQVWCLRPRREQELRFLRRCTFFFILTVEEELLMSYMYDAELPCLNLITVHQRQERG